ncbi:MAG: S41 family peptidase [Bacteroidaceae bacterium]|nr:S41 family peptidase [Bacteroidaceae bacterium]MBQ9169258.1 S41 family peptidase [Bacteroidaceae bacterium]MBQ9295024.1 S41 family peptidase [Bacteroidaceae bacterium]
MNRFLAILALLLLMLTSCQKSDYDFDDTPQGNLDALWQLIDERYCFLSYKEEVLGMSWADIRGKYSGKLNADMSRVQLFEVLCQMLSELKDGHVNLSTSLDMGRNWSWKEDYPENLNTELRQQYLGTDYHIGSGLRYTILPDNIAYVVYESFSQSIGEGNLSDMIAYLQLCNGMILDIRGNGGGDLSNVEILSRRFTNEKVLVGYTCYKTGKGHDDFSEPRAEYVEPYDGIRWQKPVVLLTNRSCYSAANTFVRNMKEMPLVTIMGDQTGGGSGLPFTSELPIGWSVRFSASPSFDAKMQQIEFGIEPDVSASLDEAKAADGIDTMIEQARELLKK